MVFSYKTFIIQSFWVIFRGEAPCLYLLKVKKKNILKKKQKQYRKSIKQVFHSQKMWYFRFTHRTISYKSLSPPKKTALNICCSLFFHISRGNFTCQPIKKKSLTSPINFYSNMYDRYGHCTHCAALLLCWKSQKYICSCTKGFQSGCCHRALGCPSGSSQLISVSTCLLCQEFSRLMSTLISQHSLLPADGMKSKSDLGI